MNVSELIAKLQELPGDSLVRVVVGCAKDTVCASLGEVKVRTKKDEVILDGWAANTRFDVRVNDPDDEEDDSEDDNDE